MNNEEIKEKPEKKKHFPIWVMLLIVVIVYALGILTGLKLSTMNAPFNVVDKLFPAEQTAAAPETNKPAEVSTAPAAETAAPEATTAPDTTETPAPTETPEETEEPVFADDIKPQTVEASAPVKYIGIDSAVKAALDYKGLNEKDVELLGVYRENSAGVDVYAVELSVNDKEYRYDVNALTGEIEGWRQLRTEQPDNITVIIPETESSAAPAATAAPTVIEAGIAKEYALKHAGLTASEVTGMKTELVNSGSSKVYAIEFNSKDYHYTYKIDAYSGEVLGSSNQKIDAE